MGRYIAKLGEQAYVEWSTVVDAPVSWVMPRGRAIVAWGINRVGRADQNGTSILDGHPAGNTPGEIVSGNRAGPNESELTAEEIIAAYAVDSPADWTVARV